MKANEAPEKLYLLPNGLISYCGSTDENVEYTRTDAFIEKAVKWLRGKVNIPFSVETNENGEPYADSYIEYATKRLEAENKFLEAFKKFMMGE